MHPNTKQKFWQIAKTLLMRLERFGTAIDLLAQSSPQILGLNLVGLLWGSLKFIIIVSYTQIRSFKLKITMLQIAHDIIDTFEAVLTLLSEISEGLRALETYIDTFGGSEIRLLERPLITVYFELITLGIKAVKLFDRSAFRKLKAKGHGNEERLN